MKTFLSIIGTTSTGKTDVALQLAQKLVQEHSCAGVALISADSQQVYQGLEILSGADISATFSQKDVSDGLLYSFFSSPDNNISLHGQSIITPDQDWSVAHFIEMANNIVAWADKNNYLSIIVGGTGLYHAKLDSTDNDLYIPPNEEIRSKAAYLTLQEMQHWAERDNPLAWEQLNNSDRYNTRRLVRLLEKTYAVPSEKLPNTYLQETAKKHLTIGLERPVEEVLGLIVSRVKRRWEQGALDEVRQCINKYGRECNARTMLGFQQLQLVCDEQLDKDECLQLWQKKEEQYVKRQLTWWKKHAPDVWLAVDEPLLLEKIITLIEESK